MRPLLWFAGTVLVGAVVVGWIAGDAWYVLATNGAVGFVLGACAALVRWLR